MRLSIVVPVLNEQDNIVPLYERVVSVLRALGADYELIFVDDGSSDESVARITALHARDPRVKLLSFSRNFGHQTALTAGLDYATGDAVISMDADLQHPPELIAELVARWQDGYEVVYTVREATEKQGFLRRVASAGFYRLFRWLSGLDLPANTADFRLLDRKVVAALRSIRERARFLRGLTRWVGFRSVGVPYRAAARLAGAPKYNLRRMLRFALDATLSFSTFPLYLAIYVGAIEAVLGVLYALFALLAWLISGNVVPGWTSLIILVAVVGGLQLMLTGVIGLYVGKIYEETKQRPLYLVRHTLGFEPSLATPSTVAASPPPGP
jgi:glycosyltransferase involved in cell wall biosynthesis